MSATGPVSEAEDRTQLLQPRGCVRVCVCVPARSFPLTMPNHRGWGAVGVDRPQGLGSEESEFSGARRRDGRNDRSQLAVGAGLITRSGSGGGIPKRPASNAATCWNPLARGVGKGPRHAETAELNRRQDQGGETCPEGLPLGFGAAVELQPQQTLNPRQKPGGRTHHRCGWWVVGKGFSLSVTRSMCGEGSGSNKAGSGGEASSSVLKGRWPPPSKG